MAAQQSSSGNQRQATGKGQIQHQISLPLREAFRISIRNIVIRLGRAAITASGVFLGIAFLSSILTSQVMVRVLHGEVDPSFAARQGWLVKMSLVVAAVGISNSMFMSVTERFREIGTMKCLGALDSFVVKLFLIESGLLGLAGSLAGVIVGFGVMMLLSMAKQGTAIWGQMDYTLLLSKLGYAVVAGVALSIVAAVPPAIKAAKMPAAAALRTEV